LRNKAVQELLNDYNIDSSHVTSWVKTSSCQLLKNELETNGTILIFPEWSICHHNCKTIPLRQKVNMYVWCSDEISQELETLGIKDKIQQLFQISDISTPVLNHNIM
ncbi:LysR family transcriptional regulator, partial [Vibrio lentus]